MLRAAAITLAIIGLCGPARAGVLSATDVQRLRDHEQLVVPAAREIPALRDMAARIDTLIAMAQTSGDAIDGSDRSDFQSVLRDLQPTGGAVLERMVARLQAIETPGAFAPPAWAAILAEVKAEIDDRLAYDADLLRAYRKSDAAGAPGLGPSFIPWEERPDAAVHWRRFQAALSEAEQGGRGARHDRPAQSG